MLSVLFCSRAKDNPDSALRRLLDTACQYIAPHEREHIEFLIKFDDDDDIRMSDEELAAYPFTVRSFTWSRGEGRHGLHNAQEYLFTQRDPQSRFCLMIADDFFFTRPNFVSEILAIKDEFCILGCNRPPIEQFVGIYENDDAVRRWNSSFGALAPVVSSRLIEVCQNFGWQSNVDSWLMGLSVVLYDLYRIVIWQHFADFYERGGGYGLGDTPTFNNMEVTARKTPQNKYWFELLRRQARNIYLNMEYGTEFHRLSWKTKPKRLWKKIVSQPLYRLPYRVCRRVWREVKTAMLA